MHIDILTLFPQMVESFFTSSIMARAVERGLVSYRIINFRDFATDSHRTCDDIPYGGGAGMVLKCEPLFAALDSINAEWEQFDCVVIIRGGGATSDLSGFDTLALAENVANFPLPIITGIGHERDESVLDMISFQRVKTPTAAAAFLVNHLTEVYARVVNAQEAIVQNVKHRLQVEKMRLERLSNTIPVQFSLVKTKQGAYLDRLMSRLSTNVQSKLSEAQRHFEILSQNIQPILERKMLNESHRLQLLSQRIQAQDPELLLKRGYSITLKDGKSIHSASQLKSGDIIETRFAEGSVKAKVE